jgi:hypothetical protein
MRKLSVVPNAHQVGGINIPAAIGLGVMIVVFAASLLVGGHSPPSDADPPDDDQGRGGGPPRRPPGPEPGPGGMPLPLDDAEPSARRLRGERPSLKPPPRRRHQREPGRRRTPPTRVNDGH